VILRALDGNSQRLDGGAMFGNCPRALLATFAASRLCRQPAADLTLDKHILREVLAEKI
jgi:hypothetical protein